MLCKASCMLLFMGSMAQAYAFTIKSVDQKHVDDHLKAQHTLTVVTDGTTANYDYVWYVAGDLQSSNASKITVSTGIQPKVATVTAYSKTDTKRVNPLATLTFEVEAEQYAEKHIIATGFSGGTGTKDDPYMISNAAQLSYLSQQVSGTFDREQNGMTYYKENTGETYSGKYFCLSNDINLKDAIWHPIGAVSASSKAKNFSGNFDGAGFSVTNMHIVSSNNFDQNCNMGLFGTVAGTSSNWAAIQNLVVENAEIVWSSEKEPVNAVGIVAGQVDAYTKLQNLIVRNSAIEHLPGNCEHGASVVNIGSVIGSVGNNKVNYNIHNIASDADIIIDDAYTSSAKHSQVRVGGIFGLLYQTYDISSIDNNFARDLYYNGILDVKSADRCLVGTIFGEGSEDAKKKNARVNWYYANARGVKSEDQGSRTDDFDYIKGVFNTSLEILYEQNSTALFGWTVNDEKNQFAFDKINVEETAYDDVKDVYTLTARTMLQLTAPRFEWYILSEAKNSIEQSLCIAETTGNTLSLSYMLSGYKVFVKVYEGSRLRAASLLHELSDRVCDVQPTHSGTTWRGPSDGTKAGTYSYEWFKAGTNVKEGTSTTSTYTAETTDANYQLRVIFKNEPDYPVYSTHVLNTNAYELIDGQVYNEKNGFDTKQFTYKRTFKNTNWQAFILPVSLEYADWSDRFEMAEFYDVNVELNATETGFVGSFVQVKLMKPGTKTVANVPYMIRLKDKANVNKELTIVKKGQTLRVEPATPIDLTCSDIERDFTFRATYVGIAAPGLKNRYAMSSGSWKTSSTASLSAERVYLEVKERTFKQKFFTEIPERHAPELRVRIVEDDEVAGAETAIEQIENVIEGSSEGVTTVASSLIGLSAGTYHIGGKTVEVK